MTQTFDPLVINALGESFKLTRGRISLRETGEKARGDGIKIEFQDCDFQPGQGIYKKWYIDNVTRGTENLLEVDVWFEKGGDDSVDVISGESKDDEDDVEMSMED